MDDGKSIRYKDLYALFEHILEKTMRQEQRDWRESPVRVWVNTFKVFLDEFMTEYKPLDSTLGKVITGILHDVRSAERCCFTRFVPPQKKKSINSCWKWITSYESL